MFHQPITDFKSQSALTPIKPIRPLARHADKGVSPILLLLLAACGGGGGGGGVSVSGTPQDTSRIITFDGDAILGSTGDDLSLYGTNERDIIVDNRGSNNIDARDGNDYIVATGTILGGEGNDFIFGDGDSDEIHGEDGNDLLSASSGNIFGGAGHDYIQISFNDNKGEDYGQDIIELRAPFNESFNIDELITISPRVNTSSRGTTNAYGGEGNDVIYVASIPNGVELNIISGGAGHDRILADQNSRITGGVGDDEFFFYFGNVTDENANTDLLIEISDFGNGDDKLVLVYDEESHPDFVSDITNLTSAFLSASLSDYDGDGAMDDLIVNITTTEIISNQSYSKTIAIENLNRQLTQADLTIMTATEFEQLVDEVQQNVIDGF